MQPRRRLRARQRRAAWVGLALLLGACETGPPPVGELGPIEGFVGGVVADEPVAALVARNTLRNGGSAADAAVVLAFALAVTYPVGASLGGGGVCIVYDSLTGAVDTLEFLPRRAAAGGPVAVPGSVRGMAALHARYARLPWELLLDPARRLARDGFPVSRALARALAAVAPEEWADETLRTLFTAPDGRSLREGGTLVQIELGALISQLARRGAGDFYVGATAKMVRDGIAEAGGRVDSEDLRGYRPQWRDAASIRSGELVFHTMPAPPVGGVLTAQMWAMFIDDERFRSTDAEQRPHLVAEVSARAFADLAVPAETNKPSVFRAHALMGDYDPDRHRPQGAGDDRSAAAANSGHTASFVVADRAGSVVGCSLAVNAPFASARVTPLLGLVVAPPVDETMASHYFGPLLVVDAERGYVRYVAAAGGGRAAPAAMAQSVLLALYEEVSLAAALAAPRLFHPGDPDLVLHEADLGQAAIRALTRRGHRVRGSAPLGRVNAIHCPGGLIREPEGCDFRADPRGHGLGVGGSS